MNTKLLYRHVAHSPCGDKVMRDDSPAEAYTHALFGLYLCECDGKCIPDLSDGEVKQLHRIYRVLCARRDQSDRPKQLRTEGYLEWLSRVDADREDARVMLDGIEDFEGFIGKVQQQRSTAACNSAAQHLPELEWVSLGFFTSRADAEAWSRIWSKLGWLAQFAIVEVESERIPLVPRQ